MVHISRKLGLIQSKQSLATFPGYSATAAGTRYGVAKLAGIVAVKVLSDEG